jgi:hypothetical protein
MLKQELINSTIYNVKGEGIKKALLVVDCVGQIFYGSLTLINPFDCFTDEFKEKVLRNIVGVNVQLTNKYNDK